MNKRGTIEKKANKSKLLRQLVAAGVKPKEAISVVSALPRKNVRSQRPPIEALEGSYNVRIRAERKRNPSLASSREDRKIFAQEEGNDLGVIKALVKEMRNLRQTRQILAQLSDSPKYKSTVPDFVESGDYSMRVMDNIRQLMRQEQQQKRSAGVKKALGTIEKKRTSPNKVFRNEMIAGAYPEHAARIAGQYARAGKKAQRGVLERQKRFREEMNELDPRWYEGKTRAARTSNPSKDSSDKYRQDSAFLEQERYDGNLRDIVQQRQKMSSNARAFFAQSPSTRTEDSARRAGTTSDARTKKPKISGTRHRRRKPYIPPQPERIFVASPPSEPQIQTRTRIVRPSAQKEFARGLATGLPYAMLIAEMMRRQRP